MEYKQAKILKEYIEQLQNEAFEEGVKVTTKALSKQMSAIENGQIRQGEWKEIRVKTVPYDRITKVKKCSLCGKMKDRYVHWNYCPNCGAKMDEEVKR